MRRDLESQGAYSPWRQTLPPSNLRVDTYPPPPGDATVTEPRTQKAILLFWLPLAATWLMMSVEGPFLAAIIARLADPRYNLAAYGVAFAFALLFEAPVIMLMSASTALAEDWLSYTRLRNFTNALCILVTTVMLVVLVPPIYAAVMVDLIALPPQVARLTYWALWILLPWPAAIAYRRLYQGVLIREGLTRLVAVGTVFRLASMSATALVLYFVWGPSGAYVGAASLSVGVTAEATMSRWMVRRSLRRMAREASEGVPAQNEDGEGILTYGRILRFYYPLALTSLIGLAAQPMMTFFMGRAVYPVESLAVFPVVASLAFVFRSMGLSFQEVSIALMGRRYEHLRPLTKFATFLALGASGGLALVALTPAARFWFITVSGLSPELARFALLPIAILVPIPFTSVLLSFQRGVLVVARRTRPITIATALEVGGIAFLFPLLGWRAGITGVTAAAISIVFGRIIANTFLMFPCRTGLRTSPGNPGTGEAVTQGRT
jgi:progressive ankylosis protein